MNKETKVSIILPIYNSEKYIKETIESLINQTLKEIEIICINDGSKDSSLNIIKNYVKKDLRIKLIDKKNEGVWKARIDGIKKATGKYITFVDSDDTVEKDFVEKLLENIEKNNSDISICGFKRIDEKTKKVISKEMKYPDDRIIDMKKSPEEVITINTSLWNKLYKTSILKQIENIDNPPRILEDMMFLALAYLNVEKISFVNEYLYNYMIREDSSMNTLNMEEIVTIQEAMIQVKKKYISSKSENYRMEILASMAFLHFGISLMLKASNNKKEFKKEYIKNIKFLDDNFPEWRTTKYIKLLYSFKHRGINLKLAILKKVYVLHMFRLFVSFYKFITRTLKIDIKW